MKATSVGILTTGFATLLPLVTSSHLFYGQINAKFLYVCTFAAFLSIIAAYQLYRGTFSISLSGRWFLGSIWLVLVTQYVAAFLGVFPERSFWSDIFWSSGILFLTHIAFIAILLGEMLLEKDWTYVRRAIALSAGFFAFLLILGIQGFGLSGKFLWLNLGGVGIALGNETYAGIYLLLAFILTLIELARTKEWSKTRIALVASAVFIAVSPILFNFSLLTGETPLLTVFQSPVELLGGARASSATLFTLLAFLVAQGIVRKIASPQLKTKLIIAMGAIIVAALISVVTLLFVPGSIVQNTYIQQSTAARIIVWDAGINAIKERPILGWGPENFNFALERHFDSRLFLEENLAEIWFDRAHNVWIDTLVGSGVIGLTAFTLLGIVYIIVVYRARRRELIDTAEATLLFALVPAHLLQLQTGFDTVASYTLLAIVGGYVLWLERQLQEAGETSSSLQKGHAGILVVLALTSIFFATLPEYERQTALFRTFNPNEVERHLEYLEKSIERDSSFESLRLSHASFLKGSFEILAENPTRERTEQILIHANLYADRYKEYLEDYPDHYRARMNYAYLLLVMMTLGEDRIDEAKEVIRSSYALSPQNPIAYVLAALAELYDGNLEESERLVQEALAINPDVEFTQAAATYFERQKELFPNLTVLKLTNL